MDENIAWPAPAKLNLMLRVVGRRSDGYHELQTVFQFLERHDRIYFTPRDDAQIRLTQPIDGVKPETDLTIRAAHCLQQHTGYQKGIDIQVDKQLPMGGGLGGGSSDAATTLIALNQIWQTGLSTQQLSELGLTLGADVPIFMYGHAAWAEGIGDILQDINLPETWYLVLIPGCHVSTAEIFNAADLTRNSPRITIRDFLQGDRVNDCLPVVCQRQPKVAAAYNWLSQHTPAYLTGTGACVFATFSDEMAAREVYRQLPDDLHGFVSRGLNHSPLLEMAHNNRT